jgi:hypothetical protein
MTPLLLATQPLSPEAKLCYRLAECSDALHAEYRAADTSCRLTFRDERGKRVVVVFDQGMVRANLVANRCGRGR